MLGDRLRAGLVELQQKHEAIGDVRGQGLLLGVDLVADRDTRAAAPEYSTAVTNRALELGVNINIVKFPGFGSVLRLAPPLTATVEEIDLGLDVLDRALAEVTNGQTRLE